MPPVLKTGEHVLDFVSHLVVGRVMPKDNLAVLSRPDAGFNITRYQRVTETFSVMAPIREQRSRRGLRGP